MTQRSNVVAAAQMSFAWAASPQEYFDRMHALVAQAASRGAELIVLPQFAGDMLVGVQVPSVPAASFAELAAQGGFADWYACVRGTAATTAQFYVHTFESLAQRYGVYIVPGTISLPGEADQGTGTLPPVYHAAFLFGPGGDVLGEQRQLFAAGEDDPATSYGGSLAPIQTPLGRIAVVVGDDALHSELVPNIVSQGCSVVLNPMARRKASDVAVAAAQWRSLGAAGIYVVEAALAGGRFVGCSAIHGPGSGGAGAAEVLSRAAPEGAFDQVIDAAIKSH